MIVVQNGEGSTLQRHKQQLRDTAAKDEARADELRRSGTDDLYTAVETLESAADTQARADELAKAAAQLHRKGEKQNKRGLENLANGSDRVSEGSGKTEEGLKGLKGSLEGLETASQQKSAGLETVNSGLNAQAVENAVQGADLGKFAQLQKKDAALDGDKAAQLGSLEVNIGQREEGLQRQGDHLDSYLLAGESFHQGSAIKGEGFAQLQEATGHTVEAESLGDAAETQRLKQGWAEGEKTRHSDTSADLALSSLYQSLKAKAEALGARHYKDTAQRDQMSAEDLSSQANSLRADAAAMSRQARLLEQSGQCHVAVGRQMQCCPWTYCQGVCLERQGCAELAEAQRLKGQAGEKRAEAQRLALQAEELRAKAEDSQARADELEVKSHGSSKRSELLDTRSKEHKDSAAEAAADAEKAKSAAASYEMEAGKEKSLAANLHGQGVHKLEQGFLQQEEALHRQEQTGQAFNGELDTERGLTAESQSTTRSALKTVAAEVSFIGRGKSLLSKMRESQAREAEAQGQVRGGVESIEAGLGGSREAHEKGVEATKLLEQARELELEGLRLQNRGQKMMLEARPKLAGAAKLSAESYDQANKAERQEEEAARLIESGNQKIAASNVLREKAEKYRALAGE